MNPTLGLLTLLGIIALGGVNRMGGAKTGPRERTGHETQPTPSPIPTSTPTPTQSPVVSNYQHQIPYKANLNTQNYIPQNLAQPMMEVFDPIGQATASAQVLSHPRSLSIPEFEQKQMLDRGGKVWNEGYSGGENRSFGTGKEMDIPNPDGSIDRGLFRINSNTFSDWMRRRPELMKAQGLTNWDDMLDPKKNMIFARMILESSNRTNPDTYSWRQWYAAPAELRHPSLYPNDYTRMIKTGF